MVSHSTVEHDRAPGVQCLAEKRLIKIKKKQSPRRGTEGRQGAEEHPVLVAEHAASESVAMLVLKCILKPKTMEVPVGQAADALAVVPV